MEKLTAQESGSLNMVDENLKTLKSIFPEAFKEDGVDFGVLHQLLGGAVAKGEEKYGLNWYGKKNARQIALMPSLGTLRPCPEESVNWDITQNLFLEGDNLEVMKLLQKSYANKIKMIYIDPPYNTGNEFIYPDKFKDILDTYLRYTGQKDDEGFKKTSNKENSGRFHTNWLNMMYPRLKVARNLLSEDGVLFISIGDDELANLRKLCDELYGEENFEGQIHWRRRHNQPNDPTKMIGIVAEHILAYSKNKPFLKQCGVGKLELTGSFSNPDNDPRGDWASKPWKTGSGQSGTHYKITTPTGKIFDEEWMGERTTFEALRSDNRIVWPKKGNGSPRKKYFKSERENEGQSATNWWPHDIFGHNQGASKELTELMEVKNAFSNPKPVELIRNLIALSNCSEDDIVLDFFAGACTTFHATLLYDYKIHCICVQLPEHLDANNKDQRSGYNFCISNGLTPTIAEIGKERIRRAVAKIKKDRPDSDGDFGFKVFKLDSSNIRAWNPDRSDMEQTLIDHMEHLVEGRSEEDVLYELLLKRGVDLTVPIEEKTIAGKNVYSIGYGVLFACLDTAISREDVEDLSMGIIEWHKELEPGGDTQVVFRDSAFANDISKTNMAAILEQHGIAHVRSL